MRIIQRINSVELNVMGRVVKTEEIASGKERQKENVREQSVRVGKPDMQKMCPSTSCHAQILFIVKTLIQAQV